MVGHHAVDVRHGDVGFGVRAVDQTTLVSCGQKQVGRSAHTEKNRIGHRVGHEFERPVDSIAAGHDRGAVSDGHVEIRRPGDIEQPLPDRIGGWQPEIRTAIGGVALDNHARMSGNQKKTRKAEVRVISPGGRPVCLGQLVRPADGVLQTYFIIADHQERAVATGRVKQVIGGAACFRRPVHTVGRAGQRQAAFANGGKKISGERDPIKTCRRAAVAVDPDRPV